MIIKKPCDDRALKEFLKLVNRSVNQGTNCKLMNHDAFTLIYVSTHVISRVGITKNVPGYNSLKEVIEKASNSYPERFICVLRTNSPIVFGNIKRLHEDGINLLRQYCYIKTYNGNSLLNHAKFLFSYHFCFSEGVVYHGRYYGSTNFTGAGLFGRNYEEFYASDLRPLPPNSKSCGYYVLDAYNIIVEKIDLLSPDKLKQYINKHLHGFKKALNALAWITSHTTLVELCNAFIELQRLYLEVLSFIYDLPGKKITSLIIDQIVSTMRDRWGINIPNTSELEMLEGTDEKTIREIMELLELNEEKIREVIKKYLKAIREAVEFTLEIFKQKHYPEHVGEYFDEIEEIFVNKVRKYGEHHKRLLEKAIETIYRTPG
jgi:nucleoid DNA-binding protein